jgi:hypothetical protein
MSELALKLIAENKITKDPFLDLSKCGLESYLPRELFDCTWLNELYLGRYTSEVFSDINEKLNSFTGSELVQLEALPNLHSLVISKSKISDISFKNLISKLNDGRAKIVTKRNYVGINFWTKFNSAEKYTISSFENGKYEIIWTTADNSTKYTHYNELEVERNFNDKSWIELKDVDYYVLTSEELSKLLKELNICTTWEDKLGLLWGIRMLTGKSVIITKELLAKARKDATSVQKEILDKWFKKSIRFKAGDYIFHENYGVTKVKTVNESNGEIFYYISEAEQGFMHNSVTYSKCRLATEQEIAKYLNLPLEGEYVLCRVFSFLILKISKGRLQSDTNKLEVLDPFSNDT